MGGGIDKKLFVDKDGKRIYVCCAGCLAPIKKDFAKFEKKLHDKGQMPHKAGKGKIHKGNDHSGCKH